MIPTRYGLYQGLPIVTMHILRDSVEIVCADVNNPIVATSFDIRFDRLIGTDRLIGFEYQDTRSRRHFYSVKPGELLTLAELGKLQGSCYQHQILFIINNYCSWYMSSECRQPMCNGQLNFADRSTTYCRSSVSTVIIATRTRISF